MSAPIKFASIPSKTLATSINGAAYTLQVSDILGWDNVDLSPSDLGTEMFAVLRDSTNTFMELIQIDPTTIANSTITIVKRGLDFYGGSTEISANKLTWIKNDTIVELGSNPPQMYKAITDYIDSIAIAGAPNASSILQGLVQLATSSQINAGTATGSTGAALTITPDQLLLSNYGLSVLTANQTQFLAGIVGTVLPYVGATAPTGFVFADGTAYNTTAHPALSVVCAGYHGYGTTVGYTANVSTDVFTATSHGLSNGTIIFFQNTGGAVPAGLSLNTPYYIITATTNTFQVSATSGGSAVNITDTGSGTNTYSSQFLVPDLRSSTPLGVGTRTKIATFVSRSSNVITVSGITNAANNMFQTGQAVLYHAPSGAMTGLTTDTTYYLIRTGNLTFSLATTLANAQNAVAISLSSDGSGTQIFTLTFTARTLGDTGGEENHAMSNTELLSHTHTSNNSSSGGTGYTIGSQSSGAVTALTAAGGNIAMNNMQPFTVLNFIIKT